MLHDALVQGSPVTVILQSNIRYQRVFSSNSSSRFGLIQTGARGEVNLDAKIPVQQQYCPHCRHQATHDATPVRMGPDSIYSGCITCCFASVWMRPSSYNSFIPAKKTEATDLDDAEELFVLIEKRVVKSHDVGMSQRRQNSAKTRMMRNENGTSSDSSMVS